VPLFRKIEFAAVLIAIKSRSPSLSISPKVLPKVAVPVSATALDDKLVKVPSPLFWYSLSMTPAD